MANHGQLLEYSLEPTHDQTIPRYLPIYTNVYLSILLILISKLYNDHNFVTNWLLFLYRLLLLIDITVMLNYDKSKIKDQSLCFHSKTVLLVFISFLLISHLTSLGKKCVKEVPLSWRCLLLDNGTFLNQRIKTGIYGYSLSFFHYIYLASF